MFRQLKAAALSAVIAGLRSAGKNKQFFNFEKWDYTA